MTDLLLDFKSTQSDDDLEEGSPSARRTTEVTPR
ncbi:hypothetical protein M2269_001323 [Rhodococcus sp. LBL2]|nr:hypothetical protein [Rhodococcus sp. LBL2]